MLLKFTKAPNGMIGGANLVDAALTIGFFVFLFVVLPEHILVSIKAHIDANLLILLGFIFYRIVFISLFDCTLGMKVFKIQFLNGDQQPLRIKEKLLAAIFILFRGADYYRSEIVND